MHFPIIEEVAIEAAGNGRSGKEVITLLLDRRGADVPITAEVVKIAVCGNKNSAIVVTKINSYM